MFEPGLPDVLNVKLSNNIGEIIKVSERSMPFRHFFYTKNESISCVIALHFGLNIGILVVHAKTSAAFVSITCCLKSFDGINSRDGPERMQCVQITDT